MKNSHKIGCLTLFYLLVINTAYAGFTVSDGKLLDGNGNVFIMRGINHPHAWYRDKLAAITEIASAHANTVRIVLSTGGRWARIGGKEVSKIISICKANHLICVLEVHDSTGYPEDASSEHISNASNYWTSADIIQAIKGQEDYVIINIANEPFGNGVEASTYIDDHVSIIADMRQAGINHTLMVDAANWGQDWQNIMRDNAPQIFNADPHKNTIFSVHMYEVYGSSNKIKQYMESFISNKLVLVVGEFGTVHKGADVDEQSIMQFAEQFNIGYLGWSWSGNGACCVPLDIVHNFDSSQLSNWGNILINSTHGIRQTSQKASVYSNRTTKKNLILKSNEKLLSKTE